MPQLKAWIDLNNFDKVLMNVLSNAFKYTPEGGKIQVSLSIGRDVSCKDALQNFFEIVVTDSGIGIDKDKIETLQKIVEESIHQGEKQSAQFQLEKLLNQQSKGNILLSPEERAKQLGYDISLELIDINLETDDLKDKHADDSLQTLHYPSDENFD